MSKFTDIAGGRRFPYNLRELLKPSNWYYEFKFDRQRRQRGWSDRDSWNGGDFIIEVVSGILKKLGDDKSHVDWDEYFKTNYPNNQGYKNLQQVAKDIDNYIAFDRYSWFDTLDFEIRNDWKPLPNGNVEMVGLNTPEEERQIKKAIQTHNKEYNRRYKKAQKAVTFVAVNFPGLWD